MGRYRCLPLGLCTILKGVAAVACRVKASLGIVQPDGFPLLDTIVL